MWLVWLAACGVSLAAPAMAGWAGPAGGPQMLPACPPACRPACCWLTSPPACLPPLPRSNLAVGGLWPGEPDASTPFPATLTVDYVRVYGKPL